MLSCLWGGACQVSLDAAETHCLNGGCMADAMYEGCLQCFGPNLL